MRRQSRRFVEPSLDWSKVLNLADHHNVMPLVFQALQQIPGGMPSSTRRNCARGPSRMPAKPDITAELIRILTACSHGIPPFRSGTVTYRDGVRKLALREFSDLDILVHRLISRRLHAQLDFARLAALRMKSMRTLRPDTNVRLTVRRA
jgi:hypothetical protein